MLNRIANGLVRLIELDLINSNHLWAVVPVTLERGVRQNTVQNAARPVVMVSSNGEVVQVEQRPHGYQRASATFTVILLTRDDANAETAIVDLLTDVCRALAHNRNFAGVDADDDPFLRSGRIVVGNAQIEVDSDGAGHGVCYLDVHVDYQWSDTAP
jgi:hypothetical protein